MARTDRLLVETVGDETVIYDLDSKEAHCLKSLAAVVFAHSDGRNTAADIAELAGYRLGTPVTESEVADAVAQLEQRALLDAPLAVHNGISRREAVQKMAAAAGVVVATPLIATVAAPPATAAASVIPTGGCCGSTAKGDTCEGLNPTCSLNHCCQNNSGKSCNECKCVGDKNDCELCSGPVGTCTAVVHNVNGSSVTFYPCGTTSSGACCYYTDPNSHTGLCCTVVPSGTGSVVSC